MKKRTRRILIVSIILIGIIVFALAQSGFKLPFAVGEIYLSGEGKTSNELEGCFSIDSCQNMLIKQGMPSDFLEKNGLFIQCENNKCFLKEK